MRNNYNFIKRSRFLICVRNAYDDKSTDYLLALRDALSIVIARRLNPSGQPLEDYDGYIYLERY